MSNLISMLGYKSKSHSVCSECRTRLPLQADACPECGYPVMTTDAVEFGHEGCEHAVRAMREYKLIRVLGGVVFAAGVLAAAAEAPITATVALVVGGGTYVTGLLGSWWNSGD